MDGGVQNVSTNLIFRFIIPQISYSVLIKIYADVCLQHKYKTWGCKPIQTWSSRHELSEIKKDCYKTYMVTYQLGDWTKAGVHLREGLWDLDPWVSSLSRLTKLCSQYLYQTSTSQYIIIFWIIKYVFENRKTEFLWKLFCFVFI